MCVLARRQSLTGRSYRAGEARAFSIGTKLQELPGVFAYSRPYKDRQNPFNVRRLVSTNSRYGRAHTDH